jgi:hypothetical protein
MCNFFFCCKLFFWGRRKKNYLFIYLFFSKHKGRKKKKKKMLIIFDLDQTLVCGKKNQVPRQTFHALRALKAQGHTLVVVTYNCLGFFVANATGLLKYIECVFYLKCLSERSDLILLVLSHFQFEQFPFYELVYFDDRIDNIMNVQQRFPSAICIAVSKPLQLFQKIKNLNL